MSMTPGYWETSNAVGTTLVDILARDNNGDEFYVCENAEPDDAEAIAALPRALEILRLCITNAQTAADYAGTKGQTNADTLTLLNAPNWPGIQQARELLAKLGGSP